MKKVFEFIKNLPKWVKAIIPITLLIILFTVGIISSLPKTYPEGSIVSKRNESYGVYYKGRSFVEISTINIYADVTLKRVDVQRGMGISPMNGSNFYSVEGLDPRYVLLRRNYDGDLHIYLSLSETPYYKGEDLYEDILKLSENTVCFNYQRRKNALINDFCYYNLNAEHEEKFKELFAYLNEADFMYRESVKEIKDKSLESNNYYIEAEFANGFCYNIRLFEGGYVIPCGAGDICQKIPDKLYNEIKAILDDESSGRYVGIPNEYKPITELSDIERIGDLESYIPSYIPNVILHRNMGEMEVDYEIKEIYVNYEYVKETGVITGTNRLNISYSANLRSDGYGIEIVKKSAYNYYEASNSVKAGDFSLEWLYSNYHKKQLYNKGTKAEHTAYSYHFSVDYGDVVVRIDSEIIKPEDVYEIVMSINP